MKKGILDGTYVIAKTENKVVHGTEVEIITFGGEHRDENLVREVKTGRCSLFNNGILKLSWNEMDDMEIKQSVRWSVEIRCLTEWENVDARVTDIVIPWNCCNKKEWNVFDVSGLKGLKSIEIDDYCFEKVNEVKFIGLHALERVVIGENSFTKHKNWVGFDSNCRFYLKDCENLRELKIDRYSFNDFKVCEIANVPSLEMIEVGELKEWSNNFYFVSLELKSDGDGMK